MFNVHRLNLENDFVQFSTCLEIFLILTLIGRKKSAIDSFI